MTTDLEKQEADIAQFLTLRKRRDALRKEYERLDAELIEQQELIERDFIGLLKTTGGSVTLPTGRATHSIKTKMQVSDAAEFYDFIADDPANRLSLLQRRIAPRNHDDFCKDNDLDGIPGVHYEKHHAVTFYKSTKTPKRDTK